MGRPEPAFSLCARRPASHLLCIGRISRGRCRNASCTCPLSTYDSTNQGSVSVANLAQYGHSKSENIITPTVAVVEPSDRSAGQSIVRDGGSGGWRVPLQITNAAAAMRVSEAVASRADPRERPGLAIGGSSGCLTPNRSYGLVGPAQALACRHAVTAAWRVTKIPGPRAPDVLAVVGASGREGPHFADITAESGLHYVRDWTIVIHRPVVGAAVRIHLFQVDTPRG